MIPRLWEVNVHSAEKRSTPRPAGAEEIAHAKSAKDGKGGFKIRPAVAGSRMCGRIRKAEFGKQNEGQRCPAVGVC